MFKETSTFHYQVTAESIFIPSPGGQAYNLQILDVTKSDEGFYKCAVEGTDQHITSQLRVLGKSLEHDFKVLG